EAPLSPELLWTAAPVAGLAAYLGYWWSLSGHPLAPLNAQANWQRALSSPLTTLVKGTRVAFQFLGVYPGGYHTLDWFIAVFALVAIGYASLKLRPSYWLWAWSMSVVRLMSRFAARALSSASCSAVAVFRLYC